MELFLKGKDKGKEIQRSITECPHIPARNATTNNVARTLGAEGTGEPQLTALDLENIDADNSTISELVFGIPPSLFAHIKHCKSAKEIWDLLQDLLEGSENVKEKKQSSVVNDYNTFTTAPGETVQSTANWFRICVNNLSDHDVIKTPFVKSLVDISHL